METETETEHLALLAAMVEEMRVREAPLTLVLRPQTALQLAGLLQLARRHPSIAGSDHARVVTTLVEHVRAFFADAPAVLEVLRRGDRGE